MAVEEGAGFAMRVSKRRSKLATTLEMQHGIQCGSRRQFRSRLAGVPHVVVLERAWL